MNPVRRRSYKPAIWSLLLVFVLAACNGVPLVPYANTGGTPAPLLAETSAPCKACAKATRAMIALTQAGNNTGNEAAATAEIVRANAQATLNAADATLSAAQTQDQSSANIIAAQIASTAEIERARAQATLVAAGFTQSAALTQDAIRQTQGADQATTRAEAAATQTESVNAITTQTQMAVQWSANQARQRAEDIQAPIAFLWAWCLPPFVVLLGGVALWGFWRWLKIRQTHQQIMDEAIERLQIPAPAAVHRDDEESSPYREGEDLNGRYRVTQPEDQVHRWLEEVKGKLQSGDRKDEDNDADS